MFFDTLFLAQNVKITNWLSPVWILSVGVSTGFLLVIIGLLKIRLLQRVSFFNSVTENRTRYWIFGTILSLLYLALFVFLRIWLFGGTVFDPGFLLALAFLIPIAAALGFGVWALVARQSADEFTDLVFDGYLKWFNRLCIGLLLFAIVGFALHPVNGFGLLRVFEDPPGFMKSLVRLPALGTFEREFVIPPSDFESTGERVEIRFDGSELATLQVRTNRRLEFSAQEITPSIPPGMSVSIDANEMEPYVYYQRPEQSGMIPAEPIEHLYIKNLGRETAEVKITYSLRPVYREAAFVPVVALAVMGFYFGYLIFAMLSPKIAAIALSTYKTEVGQPLFWLILAIVLAFILLTIFIPYNTFGEDIKMYTDSGLTLIRVAAIFLAIWAASKSVAEEIEGRTALTVLSKPVGRRQFVLGKFFGISMAIALLFAFVGLWFFTWVAFKPIYDFQEASKGLAEWDICFNEAAKIVPGLFLCFLEAVIFVAISVSISTRLGILANFLVCFSIYVLGHLTPLLVQSSLGAFEVVAVFGQVIAIIFPVLNHFDIQTAINTGETVPLTYLGWAVIYTGVYSLMVLLLALVLFEDRDLA
jgi:ABC-type transport system involved in multi-copper enzyme maturation permease subunit